MAHVHQRATPVFSPTLLLVEIAAAVARAFDDSGRGIALAQSIRQLPGQVWLVLDQSLAAAALTLAARRRLRGADAVYAAVAERKGSVLVTLDRQQLTRLPPTLTVVRPAEALTMPNI